jgi:regulator of RNase E activity RraB
MISVAVGNGDTIMIRKPDDPEWYYLIEYHWPIEPFGHIEPQAMYNFEGYVVSRVLEILREAGIRPISQETS